MSLIEQKLRAIAVDILPETPVRFAYLYGSQLKSLSHPFSDLDIGIYIEDIDIEACLDLELSLSLRFDEKLNHQIQTEVRILNHLPLYVKGRIMGESRLIYSIDEEKRIAFETRVRRAYFDFIPVVQHYRQAYRQHIIAELQHDIY